MPFGDAAAAANRHRTATPGAPAAGAGWPARSRLPLLLAAIAVLWMATRPYPGIFHDARLYTVQALSAADPARFADDLFLGFGSQDRFTVFSRLYAPVLRWAGISLGTILLTLLAQATWLCGAYGLARAFLGDPARALAAVAGLVALPSTYGAASVFSYGEPFLTPRLFAEALTMLALGCTVRGSTGGAAVALAAAGAFHPIMAAPGAAALFLYKASGNRAWWAAAACATAAAVGLAALGAEPFARLGVRFDLAWFEVVRHRAAGVFIAGWSPGDYCIFAGQAALAVLALALPGAELRRLVFAVLLTAAAGLALTAAGADLARNQLLTNLQPWRAAWLLGVVAHLLAVPLLMRLAAGGSRAARDSAGMALAAGVGVLAVARFLPAAREWSTILLASAVLLPWRRAESEPVLRALVAVAAAAAAVGVACLAFAVNGALETLPEERRAWLLSFGLCASGSGLAAVALRSGPRPGDGSGGVPGPALAAAAAAVLLFCAAAGWDRRSPWTAFVEAPGPPPAELAGFIPDDATVYWDGGLELLWLRLGRSSYHSCSQGAGVIFFRETALAFQHRSESFRFETTATGFCASGLTGRWETATPAALRRACAREPELDWIVLPYPVPSVPPRREWASPAKLRVERRVEGKLDRREFDRFYAYACDGLR